MKELNLGKSVKGKAIKGYAFGNRDSFNKTFIIGGIHGSEPQSAEICELYLKDIKDKPFQKDCFLILIPCINPDGIEAKTRVNANGVDLNRNFPTSGWQNIPTANNNAYYPGIKPASEPETKIIVNLINKVNFKKFIAIHTNHVIQFPHPPMVNYDGEQSRELAEKMSLATGLITQKDMGYPSHGSLGSWIGKDLKKIAVTLELDNSKLAQELYKNNGMLFEVGIAYS